MTMSNPYAPPQAGFAPSPAGAMQQEYGQSYVPLGWRTALASISVLAASAMGFAMHGAQMAFADDLHPSLAGGASSPELVATLIVGACGLGVLVAFICAWVFIPVWMHRASSNLRGLGRFGMTFSPAGCAGWFFVPIANLWKPPQAMSELWRASDPDADQGSWFASRGTSLVAVWWAAYLMSSVVSWGSVMASSDKSAEGAVGLVSNAFQTLAAIALVMLMRGVSARQAQSAGRMVGTA
ncbi:MAG TPA: DUF4328 domain-containing protein [Polyangiaceae bacterium]|jgi:hypothetical protein